MKQLNNFIFGDNVKLDSITKNWNQIKIHPAIYYRRYDQFLTSFKSVKGFYVTLDLGQYISVRFSEKDDITEFYRSNHGFI